jgi:hypothetical protein
MQATHNKIPPEQIQALNDLYYSQSGVVCETHEFIEVNVTTYPIDHPAKWLQCKKCSKIQLVPTTE